MRGSRGKENSRTMLLPLIKNFRSSVTVALYHTPMLRGVLKKLLPERFNEIIGLNHIKAYIFDNTVVISGLVQIVPLGSLIHWNPIAYCILSLFMKNLGPCTVDAVSCQCSTMFSW